MSDKNKKEKKSSSKGKAQALQHIQDNARVKADSSRFVNRELSWLDFNNRVLSEARDTKNPLLERAKFLAITASNLDEFYVVRVASLKDMVHAKYHHRDISGMNAKEQLTAISKKAAETIHLQFSTFNRSIVPALRNQNIFFMDYEDLDKDIKTQADEYFLTTLYPILTPMAVDSSRPFPLLQSQHLNLAVMIDNGKKAEERFGTMQIPSGVPRIWSCNKGENIYLVPVERLIQAHLSALFEGQKVSSSAVYRIIRNADLDIDEDEAADLLKEIEEQVKMRQWGEIIRLETEEKIDPSLLSWITNSLEIGKEDTFLEAGPLDLTFLMKLYGQLSASRPDLCYTHYKPQPVAISGNRYIFDEIRERDILLHHPYESFDPVVEFIRAAARDDQVLAIKQTLYRVSSKSPIIRYLEEAAENGKQVMVLVELKARFDEENNINWAKQLERAGCHVIYGLVGLKTHSKITLVVRNEEDRIRRYLHLGTGNYNDITAGIYTDFGLFTCAEPYGIDASEFFNMISGYSEPVLWRKLILAPMHLRTFFEKQINQEIKNAKAGKKAAITAKMNSLADGAIISLLYEASQAGVKIDLIVRGICCLKAGVEGLSENITVRSIVGRFLEHSRIFCFHNDGEKNVFLGSADWMPRNLDRRVELLFPVEDEVCRSRIFELLQIEMEDTIRSHLLQPDGTYQRIDLRGKKKLDSQAEICRLAQKAAAKNTMDETNRHAAPFTPITSS